MIPTELKCNPQYIWNVKLDMDAVNIQLYFANVLWVAFSTLSGSLLLVNHLVYIRSFKNRLLVFILKID
jgi:hypothetical protein